MSQIRLGHQELQYSNNTAPVVFILIVVHMFILLFFGPLIAFFAFLIFTVLVFFSIDKNISYLDQKIKRLEFKIRDLESRVE